MGDPSDDVHNSSDTLRKVYVEPTNACNLDCTTCIRHSWDEPEGFMEWSTFEAVVDGLAGGPQAGGTVAFMGLGEPLLHPRFLDMVRLVKARGLRAEVTTNALLDDGGATMTFTTPEEWAARALALGADAATLIDPTTVVTADWVRMICLYGCDDCTSYRTCPPHSPEPDLTRRVLDGHRQAMLLEMGPIVGRDQSGPQSRALNEAAIARERELFLAGFYQAWTMGAGPCDFCAPCDPSQPCASPERARPSMEGCAIDVFANVRGAGRKIEVVSTEGSPYRFFALGLME